MPRRTPPTCADCRRPILWAHIGKKNAPGTRYVKLEPGDLDPDECIHPVPFEGQALHHCYVHRELVRDFARALVGPLWLAAHEHICKLEF